MKQIGLLGVLLVIIFIAWNSSLLYPLKILVVFFHESSHALATVITGGKVMEMVVVAEQGGHVVSLGGSRFITLNAGYLGSLFWGVIIYLVAAGTRVDRPAMFILGSIIIIITLAFVTALFAFIFGLFIGGLMIVLSIFTSERVNDFLLRLIGLTSMIYTILDIVSDTITHSELQSDARMLAEEFGGSTIFWGGFWCIISGFIILFCLFWTLQQETPDSSGEKIIS